MISTHNSVPGQSTSLHTWTIHEENYRARKEVKVRFKRCCLLAMIIYFSLGDSRYAKDHDDTNKKTVLYAKLIVTVL